MPRFIVQFALLATLAIAPAIAAEDAPFDYAQWRQFWSFKPVVRPQPPTVTNKKWVRNPIDAFILAKLEAHQLSPALEADKLTLIRRATLDLTGLPPTLAEIDAFLKDTSPDAYEKLIKRLLDSPHYGERYGRHWLDVVRYEQGRVKLPGVKNTRGELAFRDYVVRSFNQDKPYDRLIVEHLAGDLLPPLKDREAYLDQITAPAFLSIGNWFDECTDPNRLRLDIIDEQINTVSKAFLGLTVSCARCHDHKFDPISERDYYALGGVFASTRIIDTFNENWKDGRVRLTREMAMPDEVQANEHAQQLVASRRAQEWELVQGLHASRMKRWKQDEELYRRLAAKLPKVRVHEFEAEDFAGQSNLKISEVAAASQKITFIEAQSPGEQWVKYEINVPAAGGYWLEVLSTSDAAAPVGVRVGGARIVEHGWDTDTGSNDWSHAAWHSLGIFDFQEGINTIRIEVSDGRFPRVDRIRWYSADDLDVEKTLGVLKEAKPDWDFLDLRTLVRFAVSPQSPFLLPGELIPVGAREGSAGGSRELAAQVKNHPRLVAAIDYDKPADLPVHIGGDTYRVSKSTVPRGVPVLFEHAVKPPVMPQNGSGRLELAKWLTDAKHPLTARVMVNRLWQWHFGRGIVESSNDFGSRGTPPTHPELLDWLAATFTEEGWSMKKIHYLIMTSATYRQATARGEVPPASRHVFVHGEPRDRANAGKNNRQLSAIDLLAGFPRRRLEVEAIYDAMLATTGKVARQPSGKPLDFDKSADRLMYVLTANRSPTGLGGEIRKMFGVFGYDPTGEPIERRDTSTTAAQALWWLNNPIPKHFAGVFAKQLLAQEQWNDAERIRRAYRIALTQEPDEETVALVRGFLDNREKDGMKREEAWTEVCLAIYASSPFRYLE